MGQLTANSPWSQIIGALSSAGGPPTQTSAAEKGAGRSRNDDLDWPEEARIRIIDRLSLSTVAVSRGHPCMGACRLTDLAQGHCEERRRLCLERRVISSR